MTNRGISRLLDHLRRQAPPGADLVPDGVLLGKYADARDEPAFELLVRRHGPLVWSAVRRILRDEHACEDALQATFLALARKASSLRESTSVAGWLYRVAVRIALRARPKSQPTLPVPEADGDPAIAVERSELIAVVDEEVNRLPERLRHAVVLCCFTGHSTDDAAQQLGCPRGTVLSRLHAAREKLRQQLIRRGFESVAIGPLLTECSPIPVPSSVIAIALRAVGPAAALSPVAITLAQGALTAMYMTKVKIAAVALFAAAGLGIGATHWAGAGDLPQAKDKPATAKSDNPKTKTTDQEARLRETEDRVMSLMRRAEEEAKRRDAVHQEDQDRLAKAEAHLWRFLDDEGAFRRKLMEMTPDFDDSHNRLSLEAIDSIRKKSLEKLYELSATKDIKVKLKRQKSEEYDLEIEILEASLRKLEASRQQIRKDLRELTAMRLDFEEKMNRSKLRESLELEKYRKLLK